VPERRISSSTRRMRWRDAGLRKDVANSWRSAIPLAIRAGTASRAQSERLGSEIPDGVPGEGYLMPKVLSVQPARALQETSGRALDTVSRRGSRCAQAFPKASVPTELEGAITERSLWKIGRPCRREFHPGRLPNPSDLPR
jgi:hypothetical protein